MTSRAHPRMPLAPALLTLAAAATAAAALPPYHPLEAPAIAGRPAQNLGDVTGLGRQVLLNDRGDLAVFVANFLGETSIWFNGQRLPVSSQFIAYSADLSNTGQIVGNGYVTPVGAPRRDGIFQYNPAAGDMEILPTGNANPSTVAIDDAGAITFFTEAAMDLARFDPVTGEATIIVPALGGLTTDQIAGNSSGQTAVLSWIGATNDDRIYRFDADGAAVLIGAFPVFSVLDRSLAINNAGHVAFLTQTSLYVSDGVTLTELVRAGAGPDADVQGFWQAAVGLSDTGIAAFYAIGLDGVQGLFVSDGTSVTRIAALGDPVMTDAGPGTLWGWNPVGPQGDYLDMNAAGDIVFWGRVQGPPPFGTISEALILARVGSSCAADWDESGGVNSNDISSFLADWLASVQNGTLAADFDQSGSVNSNDISAFLTAWLDAVNNGC